MDWWAWFVLGGLLMASELMLIDAAFYLMFIGVAASVTGLAVLAGIAPDIWMQWILFAILGVASMVVFRKRLYEKLRGNAPGFDATPKGEFVELEVDLSPGESCRITYRGSSWTVQNSGAKLIEKGSKTKINKVKGLTLMVGN
jgi:membrane protein implicated in regulation of membrane protease activity